MLAIDWQPVENGQCARVELDSETEADIMIQVIDHPGPISVVIDLFTVTPHMGRLADFLNKRGVDVQYVDSSHPDHSSRGECLLFAENQCCLHHARIATELWLMRFQSVRAGGS
jgi:hypothetical protein